ncbi:MAG TPA: CoB--CoM heterodisulfide reductase iron-sulfur subunit A family protein [Firmicutes bacterium]|nr:CoB--CoM heterodisulfide reductase iron-sulfur subunit A family protein [Bacillota bacterium]
MPRTGVFICHCGTNIAATVDIDKVVEAARSFPGVVHAEDYRYLCSEVGQDLIKKSIRDHNLDRVVVGTCSPRMHENTFRKAAAEAGLNPFLLEVANIREHCSWVHRDMDEATPKAVALVRAASAKAALNDPLEPPTVEVEKRALVIGGGIAGIQAALDIAEAGFTVDIVEREPSIGGRMAQLEKTFPTLDCSACILTPKMVEVAQHPNINLLTYSEVEEVSGYVGQFDVTIRKKARSVDAVKCTGCGICYEKCPKKTPAEFEMGRSTRKAIYVPFPQAVPNVPVIDREACLYFQKGRCQICAKECPADAVDFEQQDELVERRYGAIIVSTGFDQLDPSAYGEYGYGQHPDILTGLEFERLFNASGPTGGKVVRFSDGKPPKKVVFIQCVGSRDKARGMNYCSKICCMYTAKQAILLKEKVPDAKSYVFYIDVRTAGKGYEEFQRRAAEEYDVAYLRGQVGKIFPENEHLVVKGVDSLSGKTIEIKADMVVLAAASIARADAPALGRIVGINSDSYHFFNEAHPKLRPVETHTAGVFIAGACQAPKDIPDTVAQAGAAAAKAVSLLSREVLQGEACTAVVNKAECSGCLYCEAVCPYGAISAVEIEERSATGTIARTIADVNAALCQGCGSCTAICRSGSINLKGFSNEQILAEVDAICLQR